MSINLLKNLYKEILIYLGKSGGGGGGGCIDGVEEAKFVV